MVYRFGLWLTEEDFDRLGVELEKINEAERQAWVEAR